MLPTTIFAGFFLALIAAPLRRWIGERATWVLALGPIAMFGWFLMQAGLVLNGDVLQTTFRWVPRFDIALALRLDGLSLLFAFLITGLGALMIIYSGDYLQGYATVGRFQAYMLLFMTAMLGVVLADDLITLFVFWELTSISSYLLIGFYHKDERSRYGALKALLITGGGGLALLAGLVLLGQVGGTYAITEMLELGPALREHALYLPILLLVLLGAFTKSAQAPFHIWLPDAMQAPAPTSAYLHSATMVKAGIYLLARFHPALGGTELWITLVGGVGLITMLLGAYLAFTQNDLKALLSYSTISSLGWLVALLGLGTGLALKAAMVGILAHALYKAALFLIVGTIEHETGSRDLRELGGLRHALPVTTPSALLALISLAGLPPLLGFIAKETLFEAALESPAALPVWLVTGVAVIVAVLGIAYSLLVARGVFFGPPRQTPKSAHEPPWPMLLAPGIMVVFSLLLALPPILDQTAALAGAAASQSLGLPYEATLYLWHGITTPLLLTVGAVIAGVLLYVVRRPVRSWHEAWGSRLRLSALYDGGLVLLNDVAIKLTARLQTGVLRHYLMIILGTLLVLVGYGLITGRGTIWIPGRLGEIPLYEAALAALMVVSIVAVALTPSRIGAFAALGGVGFFMTLFFIFYSGPDLALTQLLIETLIVILLLLVFYFLPRFFEERSSRLARWRDIGIAAGVGILVTGLTLMAIAEQARTPLSQVSEFFLRESVPSAHGANVVNVILVDFRALDTLGEITVLVIAMVGVHGFLKMGRVGIRPATRGRLVDYLILRVAVRLMLPILLLFSVFLLLRGHNLPGGGFIGGLVAAAAILLHLLALGPQHIRNWFPIAFRTLLPIGLFIAIGSGLFGVLAGEPFLTGLWPTFTFPGVGEVTLGTPLLFDVGVYLVVIGMTVEIIVSMVEEEEWRES